MHDVSINFIIIIDFFKVFILWSLQIWVYVIIGPFGKSQLVLIYWNYRYFLY